MKRLLYAVLAILCCVLVGAQAQMSGTLTITHADNATNTTVLVDFSAPIMWLEVATNSSLNGTANSTQAPSVECAPLAFEGLPLIVEDGEKLSYGFAPWKTGDTVAYWIEDVKGDEVKTRTETTNKAKKQYTPKTSKSEQAYVFKAVRTRTGCNESNATAVVVVRGDGEEEACICEEGQETVCEETACEDEQTITSLYVLSKKHQEEIKMYGNTKASIDAWVFGNGESMLVSLPQGKFGIVIHPAAGENTYGIIPADSVTSATFSLQGEEEDDDEEEEPVQEDAKNATSNSTALAPSYTFEPPLTGMVIAENGSNASLIIGCAVGLVGIGLALSKIKRKTLRSAKRSRTPS